MYNPKGFNGKLSKYFFSNANTYFFKIYSDRDFYSENNNVSQVYTYITKIQKNAMHFDSFSLGAHHLFQKLVLFFLFEVILVIHCCFQKISIRIKKK
jgi:hypothetical protein